MSGRLFLDTNAVIELLKGNPEVIEIMSGADFIACSIISELEYLSFPNISSHDISLFSKFIERITVVDLRHDDLAVKDLVSLIRKTRRVKLPDAVILASAKVHDCTLLTADVKLTKVGDIVNVCSFKPLGSI